MYTPEYLAANEWKKLDEQQNGFNVWVHDTTGVQLHIHSRSIDNNCYHFVAPKDLLERMAQEDKLN